MSKQFSLPTLVLLAGLAGPLAAKDPGFGLNLKDLTYELEIGLGTDWPSGLVGNFHENKETNTADILKKLMNKPNFRTVTIEPEVQTWFVTFSGSGSFSPTLSLTILTGKPGPPTITFKAVKKSGSDKVAMENVTYKGDGAACFTGIAPNGMITVIDPK
jgi:hypothetical protein